MDVLSTDKRWLVTLVASNNVVAPVLRNIVKQGMDKLYAYLDNYLNGLPAPCSLQTLTYDAVYQSASTPSLVPLLKGLEFANINNNSDVKGDSKKSRYNYNVNSSVDLAKLYLPGFLAVFSAFDKSMDLCASLKLLGCREYPIPIFASSDPLHDIQPLADDVRENVRNPASRFEERNWTQIFFDRCFDKLKALLQYLPLLPDKNVILDQLSAWKTEGFKRIVNNDLKDLLEKFQNVKPSSIDDKSDDIPTREEKERVMGKLSSFHTSMMARFDTMESLLRTLYHKVDGLSVSALNQEDSKRVHSTKSSVLTSNATPKETRQMREKVKNPESMCKLRAKIAKLSRRTLHKAAISGRCNVVKVLLESGEDVDQTDEFNLTPLHLAAWYGQRAVVELLLQHRANVNAVDRFQKTALQKAERNKHRAIIDLLLRNNASPGYNQPPSLLLLSRKAFLHVDVRSGFNRLQAAVFQGDFDTFWRAILYLGNFFQDMNLQKTGSQAKVFPGKTASEILLALQDKGKGIIEIEEMYKVLVERNATLAELHLCNDDNDAEKAVELVLNKGVDINTPGKSNRTPLLWASPSASGEFIKTLVDLGANVNAQRTDDMVSPLHSAVQSNNYMAVDILLKHGADVGLLNISNTMGLSECLDHGFLSVSYLLIDSGCDINLRNKEGQTALYLAVKNEHKYKVKCLLESKADVKMKYKEKVSERIYLVRRKDTGKPAWYYFLVKKSLEPLFLKHTKVGRIDVQDLVDVLEIGWGKDPPEDIQKSISKQGATFGDIQNQTVLHVACKSASLEIVDLLVKHKADINANDEDGFTPLHLAAMYGNIQVVKKLVENNADVNLKVDGKDAADLARMNEETEIEEYLKPKRSLP